MASVRLNKISNSVLAEHVTKTKHSIAWEKTEVILKESRWAQRRWSEAWEILKSSDNVLNRDDGRMMPDSYIPVIRTYS